TFPFAAIRLPLWRRWTCGLKDVVAPQFRMKAVAVYRPSGEVNSCLISLSQGSTQATETKHSKIKVARNLFIVTHYPSTAKQVERLRRQAIKIQFPQPNHRSQLFH